MIRTAAFGVLAVVAFSSTTSADLVISQYYEGSSNHDKWIEIFNSGPDPINLSNYSVGLWSDANAEGYKTGAAPTAWDILPNLSLSSGGVFLMSHDEAGIPLDLTAGFKSGHVLNFTGNDSVAIYATGAYSTSALVDAIGFTNAGNQGADKGFVRLSLDQGYSTTSGSSVLNFGSVWKSIAFWEANIATVGMDAHLGSTHLVANAVVAAVPEPAAMLFGSLLASSLSLAIARRPANRDD